MRHGMSRREAAPRFGRQRRGEERDPSILVPGTDRPSRRGRTGLALVACAAAVMVTPSAAGAKPPAPTGTPTTHAGAAHALDADVKVLGGVVQAHVGPISDVALPSGGGFEHDSLVKLSTGAPLAIKAGILNAATAGSGDRTVSWASTVSADVNVADLLTIRASVLEATSKATCSSRGASFSGSSTIADLVIEGAGLTVSALAGAAPNTDLSILGLAKITVNEQYVENGRLVVNALHVEVGGVLAGLVTADVVISHAEAGISCGTAPPVCTVKDFVTGGGYITLPDGSKGTFGMVGGQKPNGLQGHFNYIDHGTGQHIQGSTVTDYAVTAATERKVTYDGTTVVRVADNGEPGAGVDTFSVSSPTYAASGPTLTRGNIQLHKPAGCTTTKPGKAR
jgi:hypothetical protein